MLLEMSMPQNLLIYCSPVPREDFGDCFYAFEVFPIFAKFSHGATLGTLSSSEDMLSSPPRPAGRPQDTRKAFHAAPTKAMAGGSRHCPQKGPLEAPCSQGEGREKLGVEGGSKARASLGLRWKSRHTWSPRTSAHGAPRLVPASPSLALGLTSGCPEGCWAPGRQCHPGPGRLPLGLQPRA